LNLDRKQVTSSTHQELQKPILKVFFVGGDATDLIFVKPLQQQERVMAALDAEDVGC
jgi:hypothetical protein